MSHSVVVTRTVTSSHEGTAFVLNTGIFKSCPGVLKLLQLLCGIVTTAIMGHYIGNFYRSHPDQFRPELFFMLISTFAFITTACVIISMILSIGTAAILPRTFFEVVYHFLAFLLLCAASITLLVVLTDRNRSRYRTADYEAKLAAACIGLVNSFFYLCSFILAIRSWRLV